MSKWLTILLFLSGGMMSAYASLKPVEVDTAKGICRIEGAEYPIVGFGSYPFTGKICTAAVEHAAKIGYRIIDTATYYKNFDAIANALKGQDRKRFYLISKVWHHQQSPENLRNDLDQTLKQLQTDYLDAYFLHWPNSEISIEKTLAAMKALRQDKKIRHIGLSNVSANHVKRALEAGVPITWVQIEMHPHFYDPELLKYCSEHSIAVQAWAPLGRGRISEDPVLARMGKKYGKTSAQMAIKWIIQHGCVPLPGSKNEKHMLENRAVLDFMLTKEEMEEIDRMAKGGERERFRKEDFGFADEFDFSYEQCWPKFSTRDCRAL